jgi:hypothetical protein
MKRIFAILLCAIFATATLPGCGDGPPIPVNPNEVKPVDQIKGMLGQCLETGTLGSEQMAIEEAITKLATQDPTKAEAIKKAFDELVKANSAATKKAKAKTLQGLL